MIQRMGFTLVEVLATLAVLSVGLMPVFQLASLSIRLTGPIQNILIGSHLSQEGVEVMRALRDNAWLAGTTFDAWATSVAASCGSGCRVQWDSTTTLGLAGSPALQRDATSGLYQYSSGPVTLFKRTITVTKLSTFEVKVVSRVEWTQQGVAKNVSIELYLFDWLK